MGHFAQSRFQGEGPFASMHGGFPPPSAVRGKPHQPGGSKQQRTGFWDWSHACRGRKDVERSKLGAINIDGKEGIGTRWVRCRKEGAPPASSRKNAN